MSLRQIRYQQDYRSGYDDIVGDFFQPSLRESNDYSRAVGYFSSSSLEAFGTPLGEFIKKGGSIRLVTSVELSEADLNAIAAGSERQRICERRLEEVIDQEFSDGMGDGVTRLVRLLELGRLEIQIAVPKTGSGIYHEKIGLFFDGQDYVAFTGSSNESRNAFENNRECIDVFTSWETPDRANNKKLHFEALWNRTDKGVEVFSFPDAAKRQLLRKCEEFQAGQRQRQQRNEKWRHQDEAIDKFLSSERGVLNMATGTGKTRTALKIVQALFAKNAIDSVVVTMDGTDLLNQWYTELLALRSQVAQKLQVYRDYDQYKEVQSFVLSPHNGVLLVSRRAGPARDPLATSLRELQRGQASRTLLIHDEVHKLGSADSRRRLEGLSDPVRYRLGLSATPDREYDAEGNQFITLHIGPELMRFELADAIKRSILAPFNYFPLPYNLTAQDRIDIRNIYARQAARAAAGDPMSDEQVWTEVARVYKLSLAKLPVFSDFIDRHQELLERCIIFVETQEYGEFVLDIVHRYRSDFHTYFSGENSDTLKRFARGDLQCLITCHRVSEGIDIRSLNSVILFSSSKARLETIQRMGRCLRTDPNNPNKIANVVDFIRQGEEGEDPNADEQRCVWLTDLSTIVAEKDPE
jgi:superfamily II DNA or RNA helicase/HKD family nuclease